MVGNRNENRQRSVSSVMISCRTATSGYHADQSHESADQPEILRGPLIARAPTSPRKILTRQQPEFSGAIPMNRCHLGHEAQRHAPTSRAALIAPRHQQVFSRGDREDQHVRERRLRHRNNSTSHRVGLRALWCNESRDIRVFLNFQTSEERHSSESALHQWIDLGPITKRLECVDY